MDPSTERFARYFEVYAHAPRPDELVQALTWMIDVGVLRGLPGRVSTLSTLVDGDAKLLPALALILRANPGLAEQVLDAFAAHEVPLRRSLWTAAWMSGLDADVIRARTGELSRSDALARDALLALQPVPAEQLPLDGPVVLDMLWGCFFVTHDKRYLHRIIEALALVTQREGTVAHATGVSALWSLQVNAASYPAIVEVCEEILPEARDGWRTMLTGVMDAARASPPPVFRLAGRQPDVVHFESSLVGFAAACWFLVALAVAFVVPALLVLAPIAFFPALLTAGGALLGVVVTLASVAAGAASAVYLFKHQSLAFRPLRWVARTVRAK